MSILFYVAALLFGFAAAGALTQTRTSIDEAVVAILATGSALLFIGGAVTNQLVKIRKAIERADENAWKIGHAQWRELREPGNKDPEPVGTAPER